MHRFLLLYWISCVTAAEFGYDYQKTATSTEKLNLSSSINEITSPSAIDTGSHLNNSVSQIPTTPRSVYSKEYYTYAAADDDLHELLKELNATASRRTPNKKHIRVVFIRTPENNGLTKAAVELVKQANTARQHTAIYVLTKQTDIDGLAQKLREETANGQQRHKPEVHFVKYRTQAEAMQAQQLIKAQYDALGGGVGGVDAAGGRSEVGNSLPKYNVAPVLDFTRNSVATKAHLTAAINNLGY